MKFTAALVAFVAANNEIEAEFLQHLSKYGKSYATREEYEFRLNVFQKKVEFVAKHNS